MLGGLNVKKVYQPDCPWPRKKGPAAAIFSAPLVGPADECLMKGTGLKSSLQAI
jgi:hypothetical protein